MFWCVQVYYAKPLAKLVSEFEKLPGIGPKSAQRLAFHILRISDDDVHEFASALLDAKAHIRQCVKCFSYSESELCEMCSNTRREQSVVCVVSEPRDVAAMEKTNEFRGLYHVLGGVISPMDGIVPDMLRIKELLARVRDEHFAEMVIATNPTIEGDATAMYIAGLIKPLGIKVTRIAHGMPVGGDMDYADQATLIQAMQWRREM